MALEKTRPAAADSGAVPVVRKAQRRSFDPTGMADATHRIAANTGWAHRSSAKALSSLQQLGGDAGKRSTPPQRTFALYLTPPLAPVRRVRLSRRQPPSLTLRIQCCAAVTGDWCTERIAAETCWSITHHSCLGWKGCVQRSGHGVIAC